MQPRGVHPLKLSIFDMLPLLIAGIGGFELFLFGQDRVRNNRSGGLRG